MVFYDCCILAFEGRGANWRLPFLPVEKVQISRALPSPLCPLCALSEALCGSRQLLSSSFPRLVETAHSVLCLSDCPRACGECKLLETELHVLWGMQHWRVPSASHSDDCVHSLTSDHVFSGFRLNCQFLSARELLNDSAHPRLLTGESNTLVGNRIFGEASNGLPFEPVPTTG